MKVFNREERGFEQAVNKVIRRLVGDGVAAVELSVREILADIQHRGDEALLEYTRKLDGVRMSIAELELPRERLEAAAAELAPQILDALQAAHGRIRDFHSRQLPSSWEMMDEMGNRLGQRVTPLERVGVYVPGGKAAYPSTVLMNVIPARVAGVGEIVMITPPGQLRKNLAVLAAAKICGVDRVYQAGGAQAIAALAYGTRTIPRVDKIVGPGNVYVTTAKRLVFGQVDIDMTAGPSEVLIISDGRVDPSHLAADLLAQAEHDERALPLLITTSESFAHEVIAALQRQLSEGKWGPIAAQAIANNGLAFVVPTLEEAVDLANRIAPEHLELAFQQAEAYLGRVRHAGAVFLGPRSAETLGDYVAGPNHVLPTMGSARFFSPLGAYDFVKRSNFIQLSEPGLRQLGPLAARLARLEGLPAHAHAVEIRTSESLSSSALVDRKRKDGEEE